MWISIFCITLVFLYHLFGFQDARNEINNNTVHITNRLRKSEFTQSYLERSTGLLDCVELPAPVTIRMRN